MVMYTYYHPDPTHGLPLEVVRAKRNTQGVKKNHDKRDTKLSGRASIKEIQELVANAATRNRNTVEPVGEVVEDIAGAGRGLGEMLAEGVADVCDGNTRLAELVDELISVGNGRNLVFDCLVDEDGHGRGALKTHSRTCCDGLLPDRIYKDIQVSVTVGMQL
jgi:hypothetical protein